MAAMFSTVSLHKASTGEKYIQHCHCNACKWLSEKPLDVFYILDNKSRSTEMVATYMYKTAFNSADFGYGSTLSVFLVIECLVAVGIIQKCLGSAKGDGSE